MMPPLRAHSPGALSAALVVLVAFATVRDAGACVGADPHAAGPVVALAITPNPVRGAARIEVRLGERDGTAPVDARVAIYDLQGRERRVLHRGPLARGSSQLAWDGRDSQGRPLGPGVYLLRLDCPLGRSIARIVRVN